MASHDRLLTAAVIFMAALAVATFAATVIGALAPA